ncbi:hypothetical protein QJQ45_025736, partial [Haematococcus lacustris]
MDVRSIIRDHVAGTRRRFDYQGRDGYSKRSRRHHCRSCHAGAGANPDPWGPAICCHPSPLLQRQASGTALIHMESNQGCAEAVSLRKDLLAARVLRQQQLDAGHFPDFLQATAAIRADVAWKGAPPAPGLVDRRVEITGPVDRKMVINAMNSGATQFMADFEDSHAPTWSNNLDGHINLRDALRRTISFAAPNGGKYYSLRSDAPVATLLVRPRGWHLEEAHFLVDGQRTSGSLFDFGLFFYHCAKLSIEAGQGPYFYLPKMESHLEA